MLYYIIGNLSELTPNFAAVEAGGVAYGATISGATYQKFIEDGAVDASGETTGLAVKLYTSVRLRDESIFDVYGFYSRAEKEMFSLLQTVSGVGPKAAMALLSVLDTDEICSAIRSDNIRAISKAQGIGAKAAQKICIDLKNKVDGFLLEFGGLSNTANVSRETLLEKQQSLDENQEFALDALISLGYPKAQAQKALSKATGNTPEELIRTALAQLF